MKKGIALALIVAAVVAFVVLYDKITVLPKELYQNRRLIWKLAKSDFKKRYAGSYIGRVLGDGAAGSLRWRCTGSYLLKFSHRTGYASGGAQDIPYILFLTAGLVPWFYFRRRSQVR